MPDELIGASLGRYEISALIGRGGMATVYLATHPGLRQRVAVKVLHAHVAEDADLLVRFEREAQAVAALRHPNIVRVVDFDCVDDRYLMVMEYIDGPTLAGRLRQSAAAGQTMPAADVVRIFEQLCSAVDYAHGEGMVHRDVKPANVLLTARGDPVLTDYGIARIVGAGQHTATGTVMGSAHYMSPEQALGHVVDGRSDLYSLGVMLFEAVAGAVPYDADSVPALLYLQVAAPIPDACAMNPALPSSVAALLQQALAKAPDERFHTGQALARALRQTLGPLAVAAEATPVTPRAVEQSSGGFVSTEPPATPAAPPVSPPPPERTRVEAPLQVGPSPARTVVTRRPVAPASPSGMSSKTPGATIGHDGSGRRETADKELAHGAHSPAGAGIPLAPPAAEGVPPTEDAAAARGASAVQRKDSVVDAAGVPVESDTADAVHAEDIRGVAVFRPGSGFTGRQLLLDGKVLVIAGVGAITAREAMDLDRSGRLTWRDDGTRAWVGVRAVSEKGDASCLAKLARARALCDIGRSKAALTALWSVEDEASLDDVEVSRGLLALALELSTRIDAYVRQQAQGIVERGRARCRGGIVDIKTGRSVALDAQGIAGAESQELLQPAAVPLVSPLGAAVPVPPETDSGTQRWLDTARQQAAKRKYKKAVKALWVLDSMAQQGDQAAARGVITLTEKIRPDVDAKLAEECADLAARATAALDSRADATRAVVGRPPESRGPNADEDTSDAPV